MSAESDLQRYRKDANRVRSDISKASSTVATQRKRTADAQAAAGRSKSPSTIRSKTSEAERATKAANEAEKKRAGLEKKLADLEAKITRAQEKVDKERQGAQDRAMKDLKRATQRATRDASAQFLPGGVGPGGGTFPWPAVGAPVGSTTVQAPAKDVFLSHASEDKDEIARPLQQALEERGVSVWFDEMQIRVGNSIRQRIEEGLANCRFGVVVISPHFFAKQWTNAELDALFTRKMGGEENMLLPVWHHVSKDDVRRHSPLLAGIQALNSAVMTVEEMAAALAEAVHPETVNPETGPPDGQDGPRDLVQPESGEEREHPDDDRP